MKFIDKKYIIVKDILKEKEHVTSYGDLEEVGDYYVFYFENIFTKYNEKVYVSEDDYEKGFEGEEYYIYFYRDSLRQKAIRVKNTKLKKKELKNITTIEKLGKYLSLNEYRIEKNNNKVRKLTKDVIIDDIFKSTNKTASILSVVLLLILMLLTILFLFNNFMEACFIFLFFMVGLILINAYVNKDKINYIEYIKDNNYYIVKEKIKKVNCNIDFKSINVLKSFLVGDDITVYGKLEDFYDTDKGDYLYLVYVDKIDIPVRIYDTRYNKLNKELEDKIKVDLI